MEDENKTTKHASLHEALAAFQADLPKVTKGSVNTRFGSKYADLADVSTVVLPLLGKHGLTWTTRPTLRLTGDGSAMFLLEYALTHSASGEAITGMYPLSEGTSQEMGGQQTYARRYCLCAVTGVAPAGDDDDGNTSAPPVQVSRDWPGVLARAKRLTDVAEIQTMWKTEGLARAPKAVREAFVDHATAMKAAAETGKLIPDEEAQS